MVSSTEQLLKETISANRAQGLSKAEIRHVQQIVGSEIDGLWGPNTVLALKTWQDSNGISANGKIVRDPPDESWTKLFSRSSKNTPTIASDIDLAQVLSSANIPFRDERTKGRPHPFTPIGIMQHHTASSSHRGDIPSLHIVRNGRSDLKGPLCNILIGREQTICLISDGHANHAGKGRDSVLEQVQRGDPINPTGSDSKPGNQWFIGIEIENDGIGEPFSENLYQTVLRVNVAICRHFSWSGGNLIGHKEWTKRKIDPTFDMSLFRKDVRAQLAQPPSNNSNLVA